MSVTAEDFLKTLEQETPEAGGRTESSAFLEMLGEGATVTPPRDYSEAEQEAELRGTLIKSAANVNADLVDIAGNLLGMQPAMGEYALGAGMEKVGELTGLYDYEDPYEDKRFDTFNLSGKFLTRAKELNERFGTDRGGKMLKQAVARDFPQRIPEGAAGESFETDRTMNEILGSYANPLTPMAGWLNAVRGVIGGTGLGTLGEKIGDEEGQLIGTVMGDLLGTGLLRPGSETWQMLKGGAAVVSDWFKGAKNLTRSIGRDPSNTDPRATLGGATDADISSAVKEIVNRSTVPDEISKITDPTKRAEALLDFMEEMANTIERGMKEGRGLGDIAQLTKNPGLINYSESLATKALKASDAEIASPQMAESYARQQQIRGEISDTTEAAILAEAKGGVAAEAVNAPVEGLAKAKAAITQRVDEGTAGQVESAQGRLNLAKGAQAAEEEAAQLKMLNDAVIPGNVITETGEAGLRQLEDISRAAYKQAWSNSKKSTAASKQVLADIGEEINNASSKATTVLNTVQKNVEKLSANASGEELLKLDIVLRDGLKAARTAKNAPLEGQLEMYREILRSRLPAANKRILDTADDAYPNLLAIQSASRANAPGLTKTLSGEYGKVTPQQVYNASKTVNKANRPMKGSVRELYEEGRVGQANVDALEQNVGVVQKQVEDLQDIAGAEIKAIDESPAAKFAEAEGIRVGDAVDEVLKGKTPIAQVEDLINRSQGNPQGLQNLKRAFIERFQNSVGKDGTLTKDGHAKFQELRQVLEDGGVLSKVELDRIDANLVENQKNWLAADPVVRSANQGQMKVAEVLSGLVGAKVGALAFGSPLIGAAYGRKISSSMYKQATKGRINDLAYELVVNPQKFADEVKRLQAVQLSQKEFDSILNEMLQRLPAAGTAAAENY